MQIGSMSAGGSVVTTSSPAANAVNLLVETVLLNYMALHGEEGNFDQPAFFPRHGLGGIARARCADDLRAGVQRHDHQPRALTSSEVFSIGSPLLRAASASATARVADARLCAFARLLSHVADDPRRDRRVSNGGALR